MRPRYMEAVEESLNDIAHLLASLLERELSQKNESLEKVSERILSTMMQTATKRDLNSKIFEITKKKMDLQLYVTDERGIVIYDSEKLKKGQDYSKKNDVYLTLQGKYGARSSLLFGSEKGLFIAAPIRNSGKIIGVLTVIKPKKSLIPFIESTRKKFWNLSLYVALSIIILFISILYFLFSPIRKLSEYVSALRLQKRVPFPKISVPEIRGLGEEMDRLFRELAGKEYVENYVQSMTHEIKSPLSSLLASSELIIENPNRLESLISNIQLEGKRIQIILEKLLELSSLENQSQLEKTPNLNLQDVVRETIVSFVSEAVRKKIKLKELTETVYVEGNFFFLGMALRNLIQNALDFSNSDSEITVRCGRENGFPFLEVEDSGPGIPSYALERIFEKFYSLPRPDTGRKSSGLGLAFVREIAKLHDADLEVKNGTSIGVVARICFKTILQ
nr:two-component system sensor histidine kinase CreC [Leptospira kirschneri]